MLGSATSRKRAHGAATARVLAAGFLAAGLWSAGAVGARAADEVKLQPAAEAWYTTPPVSDPVGTVCAVAGNCGPVTTAPTPSPYPEHTLHVSMDGGQETARTYVSFDLSSLPTDAAVTGGTLTMPVAGADAGSVLADLARLKVCATFGQVKPVAGSIEPPPAEDCSLSSPVRVAAQDDGTHVATADLGPFAEELAGESEAAFAILPVLPEPAAPEEPDAPDDPAAAAGDAAPAWHVAFHGKQRQAEGAVPITAVFEYEVEDSAPDDEEEELEEELVEELPPEDFDETAFLPAPFEDLGLGTGTEPQPVADLRNPTAAEPVVADGELVYRSFSYPLVFAIPLFLLALAWYFGRAFTAPAAARTR